MNRLCLMLSFSSIHIIVAQNEMRSEDYVHLNVVDKLSRYGYPSEVHYTTTKDGYILKIYRVPHGRLCDKESIKRTPVLFVHGLFSSTMDFVAASPENAIAYKLPDACFDTWLANSRGNFESTDHTHHDTSSREFWDFSWHEMGVFDTPALIDFVLNFTNSSKIHYIGHSQGTTQFFVYASTYPEESLRKVKTFTGLAPVAFLKITGPIQKLLSVNLAALQAILGSLNIHRVPAMSTKGEENLKQICYTKENEVNDLCKGFLHIFFGYTKAMNMSLLPIFLAFDPAGTSAKQAYHYLQLTDSGKFRPYDYGAQTNILKYGAPEPPDYELRRIKVPMRFYYADEDFLAPPPMVFQLADELGVRPTIIKLPVRFGHYDFAYGNNVGELVYDDVIRYLNES